MMHVVMFTFNPFQENTYLVWDDTKSCVIFDPGCSDPSEQEELAGYIEENDLIPRRLINTHCHLDHVFGNHFVAKTYDLPLEIHADELPVLQAVPQICKMYGLAYPDPSPLPGNFLEAGNYLEFGESRLKILLTPGHSPASLSFHAEDERFVIAGDVLFRDSIGRTDLPGGDHATLLQSIRRELFALPNETTVYPGHGPSTTVGYEKLNNPFF